MDARARVSLGIIVWREFADGDDDGGGGVIDFMYWGMDLLVLLMVDVLESDDEL